MINTAQLGYLGCFMLISSASIFCQTAVTAPPFKMTHQYNDAQVSTALVNAQIGQVSGFDLEVLRHIHNQTTLPWLEKAFDRQTDELDKMKAASVLIYLGDTDPRYWNYLAFLADKAVDSDAPDPMSVAPDGKPDPSHSPSAAFLKWSNAQGMNPDLELQRVSILYPAAIAQLADSEDVRAIPILRKGLNSAVYMIQVQAAIGLANLHDSDSSSAIIGLCKTDPTEIGVILAGAALVYFDDTASQSAVDHYLSKEDARISRQARKDGRTPLR